MSDGGEAEQENYKTDSFCLWLHPDDQGGQIEQIMFKRDERGGADLDAAAAELMGIKGERVRCFSVPHMEKKFGLAIHMYIDLQGVEHKLAHNTNATQLWLIANLPEEPPQVNPSELHGPVLLTAENVKTEEYVDLSLEDWTKIVAWAKEQQPNAIFLP